MLWRKDWRQRFRHISMRRTQELLRAPPKVTNQPSGLCIAAQHLLHSWQQCSLGNKLA
jgi:hypothetical protein